MVVSLHLQPIYLSLKPRTATTNLSSTSHSLLPSMAKLSLFISSNPKNDLSNPFFWSGLCRLWGRLEISGGDYSGFDWLYFYFYFFPLGLILGWVLVLCGRCLAWWQWVMCVICWLDLGDFCMDLLWFCYGFFVVILVWVCCILLGWFGWCSNGRVVGLGGGYVVHDGVGRWCSSGVVDDGGGKLCCWWLAGGGVVGLNGSYVGFWVCSWWRERER